MSNYIFSFTAKRKKKHLTLLVIKNKEESEYRSWKYQLFIF